jgi:heat shock protein HtpX
MATFFDEIRRNNLRSFGLILIFFVLVLALGALLGYIWIRDPFAGPLTGVFLAFIVGGLYFLVAWFAGGSMILSMSGAREVTKKEYPYLYNTVEGLAIAANVPMPKVYVIDDSAMNAFSTGRDPAHSYICVTTGLLKTMNRQELEGVVAHEMSHIKDYDIRLMMLAAVLVGVLTLLSDFLLRSFLWGGKSRDREGGSVALILIVVGLALAILSPLIGQLIQLAISRKREYLADASGAMLTRYPPGLANALKKIAKDPDPLVDTANKATANLFISTPFREQRSWITNLFSTHPPIEERIKRLEAM